MQQYFIEVTQKYKNKLAELDSHDLETYINVQKRKKEAAQKNTTDEDFEYDHESYNRIASFIEQYKAELKTVLKNNGNILTHITDIPPNKLTDGKLKRSINRLNNYETERGDWFFASSTPTNEDNLYLARHSKTGMIRIGKNAMIYGGNNMSVVETNQGSKKVMLNSPNYIYSINADGFEPVVQLGVERDGKINLEFSEEWIIPQDIDISDSNRVVGIEKVEEVTFLLDKNQLFEDINIEKNGPLAYLIRKSFDPIKKLKELIESGQIKYLNLEAGINVSNALSDITLSKMTQQHTDTIQEKSDEERE